jgi:hypothetical protein
MESTTNSGLRISVVLVILVIFRPVPALKTYNHAWAGGTPMDFAGQSVVQTAREARREEEELWAGDNGRCS